MIYCPVVVGLLFIFTVYSVADTSEKKQPAAAKIEKQTSNNQSAETPAKTIEPAGVSTFDAVTIVEVSPVTDESTLEPAAYEIPWQSINAGGDDLSSDNYQMMSSVGQSVIGYATSDNYEAGIGYWYGVGGDGGGPCDCGTSGDVNHDASTDPLDVSYLVNKVFLSQDALYDYTATCSYPNGDVNCDGSADPLDVSYLVNKVFLSQDALCERCP
jgi:hypothetical protein